MADRPPLGYGMYGMRLYPEGSVDPYATSRPANFRYWNPVSAPNNDSSFTGGPGGYMPSRLGFDQGSELEVDMTQPPSSGLAEYAGGTGFSGGPGPYKPPDQYNALLRALANYGR